MANEKLIGKILKKVKKNGFDLFDEFGVSAYQYNSDKNAFIDANWVFDGQNESHMIYKVIPLIEIIFRHDFAKAYFGEETIPSIYKVIAKMPEQFIWQYHLQQMVLVENYLKYLEKYL